jgi:flagellar hook-basal body complex protein FliE
MSTSILSFRGPNIPAIQPLPSVQPAGPIGSAAPTSFTDLLSSTIGTVEQATQNANNAAQQFLSGENEDLHTVAIAEQKAEITSDLFLQLRNKAVSAYQEIMKMQL